jgi:glycosyltransferase involved in cell wall biosynthesis
MDISVIICTRDRAASLKETLRCLDIADRRGLSVEVVVVDNDSQDATREVVREFESRLPLRYLRESQPGKSHCLNRALDEGGLGEIVAILDDDMSPREDWFQAVVDTCKRHPECDFFGGRIHAVLPDCDVPGWARSGITRMIALSVADRGEHDIEISQGEWPSGNHFWLRTFVFDEGLRFADIWLTEPELTLGLMDRGCRGLWAGAALAGHRVQPGLLSLRNFRARAALFGRNLPHARLHHHNVVPQATFRENHPTLWHVRCIANLFRWMGLYILGSLTLSRDKRVRQQLWPIIGVSRNVECLRMAFVSRRANTARQAGRMK